MPDWREILDYHRDVATDSGLRERIRFETEVVAATWNGAEWELETADGAVERFRVAVFATGFLHHPRIPDFEGLGDFAGELVHSARWRDEIVTAGRRVGVVGNGSTGVQLVGELGGKAAHLTMFQRTPQWIFPLPDFGIPAPVRRLLARFQGLSDVLVEGLVRFADSFVGGASVKDGWRRRIVDWVAGATFAAFAIPACARSSHRPTRRSASGRSSRPASTRRSSETTSRSQRRRSRDRPRGRRHR